MEVDIEAKLEVELAPELEEQDPELEELDEWENGQIRGQE